MTLYKFQTKLFLENKHVDWEACIPMFHAWIREKKITDVLLFDVADYSHVHHGPGVVLIGHEADYYIEEQRGLLGLRYSRKRNADGSVQDQLRDAFAKLFTAAALLEQEPTLGLKFATDKVLVAVNDRLLAPDTAETQAKLAPVISEVTSKLWGSAPSAQPENPSSGFFAQVLSFTNTPPLQELRARIS